MYILCGDRRCFPTKISLSVSVECTFRVLTSSILSTLTRSMLMTSVGFDLLWLRLTLTWHKSGKRPYWSSVTRDCMDFEKQTGFTTSLIRSEQKNGGQKKSKRSRSLAQKSEMQLCHCSTFRPSQLSILESTRLHRLADCSAHCKDIKDDRPLLHLNPIKG